VFINKKNHENGGGMEKRKQLRVAMENLSVDVADGSGFFKGTVYDISRFGLCVTDLPSQINGEAEAMTVSISGKEGSFTMNVRPRWYCHGNVRKSIGVEITKIPLGWTQFVMNFEPALHIDVWGDLV
jgi:hypothetical protein